MHDEPTADEMLAEALASANEIFASIDPADPTGTREHDPPMNTADTDAEDMADILATADDVLANFEPDTSALDALTAEMDGYDITSEPGYRDAIEMLETWIANNPPHQPHEATESTGHPMEPDDPKDDPT